MTYQARKQKQLRQGGENVETRGMALSRENDAPTADGSDASSLYTATLDSNNSVLLDNIMMTDNKYDNGACARQKVYSRAYLKLNEANGNTYLYTSTVTVTLKSLVEAIDAKLWDSLTPNQKVALETLYETYSDVMADWKISNLKNS